MLTLLLSAHDGGTAWRHALAPGEARAGYEPVGPLGLARRVGRILCIPAEVATAPERLAAYTQRLDQHDDHARSYSASRKQDPFGVARYLLTLRDGLRLAGWGGRALCCGDGGATFHLETDTPLGADRHTPPSLKAALLGTKLAGSPLGIAGLSRQASR